MNDYGKCYYRKFEPEWSKYIPALVGVGVFAICRRQPRGSEPQRFVNTESVPAMCTCFRKKITK
jgi:hypothetical protein